MFTHRLITGCWMLLAVMGCQVESDPISPERTAAAMANVRLKGIVASGDNGGLGPGFVTTNYEYDQQDNLIRAIVPETGTMSGTQTSEFYYDPQGRLTKYRILNEVPNYLGIVGAQSDFTYTDTTTHRSWLAVYTDGQLQVDTGEPNARETYRYDDQGRVVYLLQEGIIRFGSETSQSFEYVYENGNVVKVITRDGFNQIEFTTHYEYDDKINPYYKKSTILGPVVNGSKNNVISSRINDNTPQRKEYTYNDQGLPLTQTYVSQGAVLRYEYEPSQSTL